jgi:hypothetical protein
MKDVLEVLNSISDALVSNYKFGDLNKGGCAYFAVFVKYHLDFIGIDNQFVYIDDHQSNTPEEIMARIMEHGHRGSAKHVLLKIGDKYFDANGLRDNKKGYKSIYGDTNIVSFQMNLKDYYENAIVNKRHNWSTWYDYKKLNTELKQIINLNFETWYRQRNLEVTEIQRTQKELESLV